VLPYAELPRRGAHFLVSPLLSLGAKPRRCPSMVLPDLLPHLPSPPVSQVAGAAATPVLGYQDPLFSNLEATPVRFCTPASFGPVGAVALIFSMDFSLNQMK
jgi:hypothetical protein